MAPHEENDLNQSGAGTMYHSHGMEVFHKPRSYEMIDHDAGFNLQKLAWIEEKDSSRAFAKVRIVGEVSEDVVLVEHEDCSKVSYLLF